MEAWQRGMSNGMSFASPEFVKLPADWEKHLGKATSLVGAFHRHRPGLLEAYPKQRAQASGAWPSMRSWTNGAICAAAMEAIDAEPCLRYRAIAACVGEEAGLEYMTWEQRLDLPDPEAWITQAIDARQAGRPLGLSIPSRCDQVMAVLGALVDRVKNYSLEPNGKPPEARWLAGVDCFAEVAKTWLELAIDSAKSLYFCIPSPAIIAKGPADFNQTVMEVYKNVMAAA